MIIVSQSEFRENLKKYFDLSAKERVIITQRGTNEVIELVRKTRVEEPYLTADEFIKAVHTQIDRFPDKQ
ncbi:type II toxin-antitoxin system Phd/YefM family antitoxin [Parabacteroides sp. Marseille-P3160]|uniref:type II toxin-antitoxin system Phd/YefM family antitoxin n=1 Tax=Parabacteroides sp. Marseille-P3160 TaxID=1917887 RepID=UPI0009B965C2|nr:type II toxin-antitoxin system Phd/YefM family antitoxin [Parabacteroides sp. Marseille-P3160]